MGIPRIFTIRESGHRIHNPLTDQDLRTLGQAIDLTPGTRILDLACGSGEMLATWARDHQITGTGVDLSAVFVDAARSRADELGVADAITLVHADAAGYVSEQPVDIAACVGATWIGGGVAGTLDLLSRSTRPGGLLLVGEPYWRRVPPDEQAAQACGATGTDDFRTLPDLLSDLGGYGYDVVEMVLADQRSWDRYQAAQWLSMRRWLDANPSDELADEVRGLLATEPAQYARYIRELLGWGVFALMAR